MKQNLTKRINRLESNIVIDGAMELWPEGASRAIANNTFAYGSILFKADNSNTGISLTNSQQSSVPLNTNLQFSNQISKTAAGTLAASTYTQLIHHIEGYNLNPIYNNDFSVIFWVKSSVASNRSLSLRNASFSHSYVRQYSIDQADTWEMKVLKFSKVSDCPGTIDLTNGLGLYLTWCPIAGANVQTSNLNSWTAGNFISGIGEDTTWLTGTTHNFNIAGVMVLPGDWESLTPSGYNFVRAGRNFQDELSMSQRYFAKTYNFDVAPATVTNAGRVGTMTSGAGADNGSTYWAYPSVMRAVPTIVYYNAISGAVGSWTEGNSGSTRAVTSRFIGDKAVAVQNTAVANQGTHFTGHIVADARF